MKERPADSQKDIKDGVLFDVIDSGKWNEKAVKISWRPLAGEQQVRYYRVKYYFGKSGTDTGTTYSGEKISNVSGNKSAPLWGRFLGRRYLHPATAFAHLPRWLSVHSASS